MPVVNNGVNLVQWQLERAKSQVQQGQVLLMSAANAAKGRLHGDSREASILRAGQMDLLLPEYPMAVAMLTNAHTRGRGAVPNLPDGEMEDHEAALRTVTVAWEAELTAAKHEAELNLVNQLKKL